MAAADHGAGTWKAWLVAAPALGEERVWWRACKPLVSVILMVTHQSRRHVDTLLQGSIWDRLAGQLDLVWTALRSPLQPLDPKLKVKMDPYQCRSRSDGSRSVWVAFRWIQISMGRVQINPYE